MGFLAKKLTALVVGATLLLLPSLALAAEFELTFAHSGENTHPWHAASKQFIEQVEKESKGRIKFKSLFVLGEFGGEREMAEALQNGTLDMIIVATMGMSTFEPQLLLFDFPYLFPSFEVAYKMLDGEMGAKMGTFLDKKGFHVLAYMENDFRGMTNSKREIQSIEDLSGLKMRVPQSPVLVAWMQKLGASPTPMPATEIYSALQTGVVDGQDNGVILTYTHRVSEVQKYYTRSNHIYCPAPLYINAKLWKSMPPDLQQIMEKAATSARDFQRQRNAEFRRECEKGMEKQNVKITTISDEQYARFIKSGRSVWDTFKDRIDADLYNTTVKAVSQ